jgi:hypothetical protein
MRAQTLKAAQLVVNQKGNSLNPKPKGSGNNSSSASPGPSVSTSPGPSPSATTHRLGEGVVTVKQAAEESGLIRYALPILLIVGGAATLGGASSMALGNGAAITERVRRLRRFRLVRRARQ